MSEVHRPDHRALLEHLASAPFVLGDREGRWHRIDVQFPFGYIAISAAPRPESPAEYVMRFECTGYPGPATGCLWDMTGNCQLPVARWPNGKSRVPAVFRSDWQNGIALYLPCDRVAIDGHPAWPNQHPSMCWSRARGIVSYLEVVSELLNSNDYTGARSACA